MGDWIWLNVVLCITIKLYQVWEFENINLIKGSCFDLNHQIDDESIDLIVTDPPYGMSFVSNIRKVKYKPIANDDNLHWLSDWFKSQYRVLKNNKVRYLLF